VVCEFGAFFGRSTMALARGLIDGGALDVPRSGAALVTHDVFSCSEEGQFRPFVLKMAEWNGVAGLLRREEGRIDFLPVFDHYTAGLPPGLLARHATTLANASHDGRTIAAMHIDAPKFYPEYLQLLREFAPSTKTGCLIVFQDYFYHWSAGLIAMVQLMLEAGLIEPLETAASSLLVRTRQPLARGTVEALDADYRRSDGVALVKRAADEFRDFEMHDPDRFRPRLLLAARQLAVESGRMDEAEALRREFEQASPAALSPGFADDLQDLERHAFSLRRLYELDVS
jgi:hypothetical protein